MCVPVEPPAVVQRSSGAMAARGRRSAVTAKRVIPDRQCPDAAVDRWLRVAGSCAVFCAAQHLLSAHGPWRLPGPSINLNHYIEAVSIPEALT